MIMTNPFFSRPFLSFCRQRLCLPFLSLSTMATAAGADSTLDAILRQHHLAADLSRRQLQDSERRIEVWHVCCAELRNFPLALMASRSGAIRQALQSDNQRLAQQLANANAEVISSVIIRYSSVIRNRGQIARLEMRLTTCHCSGRARSATGIPLRARPTRAQGRRCARQHVFHICQSQRSAAEGLHTRR